MEQSIKKIIVHDRNCYDVGENNIEYIRARELLVSGRIDLIAKYKYVEAYDKGINIPFIQKLYYAHLEAFTVGKFIERGKEDTKKSYEDYVSAFHELIENIRKNGVQKEISVIPVGKGNVILNGSHRTAIAMYYDLVIPIIRYEDVEIKYDYDYFRKRLLDEQYLEYMVTEYIRLKENVFFACIWPKADKGKAAAAEEIIRQHSSIVYKSTAALTYQGLENLMIQIYGRQDWCGNIQNGYKGISGKVNECYQDNSETVIYVLDNTKLEYIVDLKQRIRDVYQIENSSVHISDSSQESLEIAHLLLNRNSVDLLNYGQIYKYKKYISCIQQLNREMDEFKADREKFLICSSGVLGLYGIRMPDDIDYLTVESSKKFFFSVKAEPHDKQIPYYGKTKEELIYDPNNYLYMYGIKFNTLAVLAEMKKRRNELKDREDCLLIEPYIYKQITYQMKWNHYRITIKKYFRNKKSKAKYSIIICLKKLHLYDQAEHFYHMINGRKNG